MSKQHTSELIAIKRSYRVALSVTTSLRPQRIKVDVPVRRCRCAKLAFNWVLHKHRNCLKFWILFFHCSSILITPLTLYPFDKSRFSCMLWFVLLRLNWLSFYWWLESTVPDRWCFCLLVYVLVHVWVLLPDFLVVMSKRVFIGDG